MQIYLDAEYKCCLTDDGTMRAVETEAFDGKCAAYIEGFRYVPEGEAWQRDDGELFNGPMLAPWRDYALLLELQAQHEAYLAEAEAAYQEGVNSI